MKLFKSIALVLFLLLSIDSIAQSDVHKYRMKATLSRKGTGFKTDTIWKDSYLDVNLLTRTATLTFYNNLTLNFYVVNWGNDTLDGHKITAYNLSSTQYDAIIFDPVTNTICFVPTTTGTMGGMIFYGIEMYDNRFGWIKAENK